MREFRELAPFGILDCPDLPEEQEGIVTVRAIGSGDRWCRVGGGGVRWLRVHVVPRKRPFTPDVSSDVPGLSTLSGVRITTMRCEDGRSEVVHDDWMVENSVHVHSLNAWVGSSVFTGVNCLKTFSFVWQIDTCDS